MDDNALTPPPQERARRLDRLSRRQRGDYDYNPGYSKLIRKLRILLPVIAAIAMTVTIVWSNTKPEDIAAVEEATPTMANAKNELLNPSFESRDEKGQPFKITAQEAVQDAKNEKLIRLNKPLADILLNEGKKIDLQADAGEYTQDERQLLLHGNVKITHDDGYQLTTEQLHVDMMNNMAQTDTAVNVAGPAGTLTAKGLKAYSNEGRLVFNGPAKLILKETQGKGLKGMLPR